LSTRAHGEVTRRQGGQSPREVVLGALVLVQVFFGIHYLAAKVLLEFIPPRTWAVLRAVSAALVLLAVARVLRRPLPLGRGDLARLALFSIFGVIINQVCFVEGLHRTTPGHSSIIMTTIPVGALLFGVILRRETINLWKLLSLVVSFLGVMLVILSSSGSSPVEGILSGDTLVGDLLTLVNALSYSFFLVISSRLLTRIDPMGATVVLLGFGALGILALGWPQLLAFDPTGVPMKIWWMGLFIVLFPTVLAYVLMYWALSREGSYMVALFIYLQPLIATALSALLLGERPGAPVLAGGGLIFLGVYLAMQPGRGASAPAAP